MSGSKRIEHTLTLPAGPIAAKYKDFIQNEDFLEMAFVGTFNTSKSTALVDWLILSGLEYPGANLVLTRAKLSDLRRTTLTKYLSRAGKVLVEDYNKNEAIIEFPEINGQKSRLYMFGLDRHDLKEVLKSFEPFRAAIEESNEVPNEAFDLLLGRLRQKVPHANRTNRWLVADRAAKWGVPFARAQEILGFSDAKLDELHLGPVQLKHVFNPEGNDHTWKRAVGVPYPSHEEIGPEWVKKNVGIREFALPAEQIGQYRFLAGDLVELPSGARAFTAGQKGENQVELVDGTLVPRAQCTFIGQRATIFAFTQDNWSRNVESDRNFLYMHDPTIREQYYEGKIDTKKGLVFPQFDRTTHVVPRPRSELPSTLRGVVSVDHGTRHPTAALFAVEVPKPQGAILILKEYLQAGRSAADNAYQLKSMIPGHLEHLTYWADPSMWKLEPTSMSSVADEYLQAGIPLYRADNNLEYTINAGQEMLRVQDDWRTGDASPRLFVSDECKSLIEALEACTHLHLVSSRDNWMVDMIDAFRYLVSGVYHQVGLDVTSVEEAPKTHVPRWDWSN